MLKNDAMFRRTGAGPQVPEEGAFRSEELDGSRGKSGELLDAPRVGDQPCGDHRASELGDVWCELAHALLDVRRRIDGSREFREMETIPFANSLDEEVLLLLHLIEGPDRLPQMILGPDR